MSSLKSEAHQTDLVDMSVTWPVSHVEMWPTCRHGGRGVCEPRREAVLMVLSVIVTRQGAVFRMPHDVASRRGAAGTRSSDHVVDDQTRSWLKAEA